MSQVLCQPCAYIIPLILTAGPLVTARKCGQVQEGCCCCSVMPDSLWPHGVQHTRLPCPLPSPRACSNSHPLSQWCHPTISSSVAPFSYYHQSFPALGSFPVSQLFASDGQSFGASASSITFKKVSLIIRRRQSWSPDLTCHPAQWVASDFSLFAQWDLDYTHFLAVISLPRVYVCVLFLGKKVPTFSFLSTKFHSSWLADTLLSVKMKFHLSRF